MLLYEYSIAPAHTQVPAPSSVTLRSGTSRRHGLEDLQLQVLPHDLSLDARRHWRRARVRHLVQEGLQPAVGLRLGLGLGLGLGLSLGLG